MTSEAYELALVCGEGDRAYVGEVFAALKRRGVRVYFQGHDDHAVEDWGSDLLESLDLVIRGQVRFAVVFVSAHLSEAFARYQRRLALHELVDRGGGTFALPVRLDDAELLGLPLGSTGTVDARLTPAGELARMLERKLRAGVGIEVPRIELRLERDPGRPPRAVAIRNAGTVAVAGCVYVARLADPMGLRAWYLTPPADLAPGAEARHAVGPPHGVERATYVVDDTTVDASLRRRRLTMLVAVRAFESEARLPGERRGTPERDGLAFPPPSLFAEAAAPDGDVEAAVFGTADGRLHRLLQGAPPAVLSLEPAARRPAWAAWYERTARRRPRPPAAVTSPLPIPLTVGRRPFQR
jgi:hypothetical protein